MDDRIISDRLLAACERLVAAVTDKVIAAFEVAPRNEFVGMIPFIGGAFSVQDPAAEADAMKQTIQALLALRWFEENVADEWHPLPLRSETCEKLIDDSNVKQKLRGYFGRSLRWTGWNQNHPTFGIYGRAVMAAPRCETIAPFQKDYELGMIFSPRKALARFNARLMSWQAPTVS